MSGTIDSISVGASAASDYQNDRLEHGGTESVSRTDHAHGSGTRFVREQSVADDEISLFNPSGNLDENSTWRTDIPSQTVQKEDGLPQRRTLSTFAGVFSPVALSMFSTVLFLRLGFIISQAGFLLAIVQLLLAYFILIMTVLSVCAISTNGAVEGGGAYFMISRALGPEFGGSIGFLFFLANIISCALYISGCVEGVIDNFGPGGMLVDDGIPGGNRWWSYLYASAVLLFCLVVCLVGGSLFAKTSVFIFFIVIICTLTVALSMCIKGPMCIPFARGGSHDRPGTNLSDAGRCPTNESGAFTGFRTETFSRNLYEQFDYDYSSGEFMNFESVFAVLFSSVTGIMNGANLSGELIEPGLAIPKGTLGATCFTFVAYVILMFFTAFTCSRTLLYNNYIFMQKLNLWPPFVTIGIFAATLSAALGNLIGASRILEALGKDQLFWNFLWPAAYQTKTGNPVFAVCISWILVQIVLLIGSLNAISPIASVFFLLAYASTNLACLGLEVASAPNFRPTFRYFSWHSSLVGLLGCLIMCFFINAIYASVAVILCLAFIIILHFRSFPESWGSISQALIFHQVRKYLLMLDTRKDHVKFWRPQILLLVTQPRSCVHLVNFINDLKKGGLYMLGHVIVNDRNIELPKIEERVTSQSSQWMSLVEMLKVKAFVEVCVASSLREGLHQLVRLSGLGGMKPNTVCLGFFDDSQPQDTLKIHLSRQSRRKRKYYMESSPEEEVANIFPNLMVERNKVSKAEYVLMVQDVLHLNKNVCLCRNFHNLEAPSTRSCNSFVDVWPLDLFDLRSGPLQYNNASLFILQLACILQMIPDWCKHTQLRIFLALNFVDEGAARDEQKKLASLLKQLRVLGKIVVVEELEVPDGHDCNCALEQLPVSYVDAVNRMLAANSRNSSAVFLYLPPPPKRADLHSDYLDKLTRLTEELPPTLLVHGLHPVTSTTL